MGEGESCAAVADDRDEWREPGSRGDYYGGGGLMFRGCCDSQVGWPHASDCADAGPPARA